MPLVELKSVHELVGLCKLALFCGKGGVGKTTLAASCGLNQAHINKHNSVLIVSTDPAHSLSSLLGIERKQTSLGFVKATWEPQVPFVELPNLKIQELNLQGLTTGFQDTYGSTIKAVMERGSLLDDADLEAFMELSLPAMGELMALLMLMDLLETGSYDLIIADTAPTGHTLRLLELPEFLELMLQPLNMMEEKHRLVISSLVGHYRQDDIDALLARLTRQGRDLARRLQDSQWTGTFVVMLPEQLSCEESRRFVSELKVRHLNVKAAIVNQVALPACQFCTVRATAQSKYFQEIQDIFTPCPVYAAPLVADELRTKTGLLSLSEQISLWENNAFVVANTQPKKFCQLAVDGHLLDFLAAGLGLVVFAGKGGVGKTTLAASSAWHMALKHPDECVLVVSIDPAHSLADSLGVPLGDTPQQLAANLFACEIDAAKLWFDFKQTYQQETIELLAKLLGSSNEGSGIGLKYDQAIAEKVLDIDSPDLDEFLVFRRLMELKQGGQFDIIILDPAPSGHLLRFLELPAVAKPWIKASLEVVHRHHTVDQSKKTVRELLDMLSAIRDFETDVCDRSVTGVVAVTTARELVMEGTKEMLDSLAHLDVPCDTMVVNMVRLDNAECSFCHQIHQREDEHIGIFRKICPKYKIITVTLADREIRGREDLIALGEALYG
ncbi:MAG: ArsA family ATPase [Candidatus Melainabacteria bacterium]|nr:ArsA family ATPase [Candidatus Melainabacteria bacterium]